MPMMQARTRMLRGYQVIEGAGGPVVRTSNDAVVRGSLRGGGGGGVWRWICGPARTRDRIERRREHEYVRCDDVEQQR